MLLTHEDFHDHWQVRQPHRRGRAGPMRGSCHEIIELFTSVNRLAYGYAETLSMPINAALPCYA
jgi:hypothetical protein